MRLSDDVSAPAVGAAKGCRLARRLPVFLEEFLDGKVRRLAEVVAGFVAALWLVIPLHELLHAAGCALTGGSVQRLEIQPVWGGALLARLFPWVISGSRYAGRLSEFHPSGDLSYFVTVLLPHAFFAPMGAFVSRAAARRSMPFLFGAGLLAAGQPIASLFGDFYEMASIVVTALARACGADWAVALRGDDLLLVVPVALRLGTLPAFAVLACGIGGGVALAFGLLWISGGVVPSGPPARTSAGR